MNVVMIVPTGIGCEIGGHAGDASPSAKLLASVCDNLIVHPNVVNSSDINEMTENMWYVEGSVLDRFLHGEIALQEVYKNKILLIVNTPLQNQTVNSVNAARNTIGCDIEVMELKIPIVLKGIFDTNGTATGIMLNEEEAVKQIKSENRKFDALAIQTEVTVPKEIAIKYMQDGKGVNPWGGAESICSKYFSKEFGVPCAHAPYESDVLKNFNEIVDGRLASEIVSYSYIHCIFKGLHKSPKIIEHNEMARDTLRVDDIDLMISPDGCWDVSHDACANWDIPIIFVRENKTIYEPYIKSEPGYGMMVDNYIEAAGVISCIKAGVTIESVRRNT